MCTFVCTLVSKGGTYICGVKTLKYKTFCMMGSIYNIYSTHEGMLYLQDLFTKLTDFDG